MPITTPDISSRIIVKNLPKWITEDRLRRHFGAKGQITDVRLMYTQSGIFRRFAYIGFVSTDEAAASVRYFDKTFVDTSRVQVEFAQRIGSEELSRPWSKYSVGSSAHEEHLRRKAKTSANKQNMAQGAGRSPAALLKTKAEEELERKRRILESIYGEGKEEEKLREFVTSMKPASQAKTWDNDEAEASETRRPKRRITPSGGRIEKVELVTVADKRIGSRGDATTRMHLRFGEDDEEVEKSGLEGTKYPGMSSSDDEEYQDFGLNAAKAQQGSNDSEGERTETAPQNPPTTAPEGELATPSNPAILGREKSADLIADTGRLFIRNLSYACTEEELRRIFEPFGPLAEVHLSISRETKKPKGFAYVLFVFPEHALRAYSQLDGTILLGRIMHLLPAEERPTKQQEEPSGGSTFRNQRERELKASAQSDYNWNSLFLRSDTVLDAIAAKLGVQKSAIMNVQSDNLATRLAIAETNLIQETRAYLEQEGVVLDAFIPGSERSKTVLLVKNLPFDTESSELYRLFSKFGSLGRLILPPTKGVALVEFFEPTEARAAFRALAYSKFKHVPLFLEWAPMCALKARVNEGLATVSFASTIHAATAKSTSEKRNGADLEASDTVHLNTATLYIKNLNFSTTADTLRTIFSTAGPIRSVKIATKKMGDKEASLGFGFVEFERKESLNRALDELQGQIIDGHAVLLKKSIPSRTVEFTGQRSKKTPDSDPQHDTADNTKLVVRNLPFEATEKEVRELFKTFAQLKRVRLPRRYDGRHRGFGFVEFLTHQEAANAKRSLAHTHFYGRHLVLEWAKVETEDDEEQLEELREKSKKRSMATGGDSTSGTGRGRRIKIGISSSNQNTEPTMDDASDFDE